LMQQESMASFDSSNSNPTHSKVVKIWWIYILRAVKKSWCCGFRPKLSIEQRSVRQNQVDQRPVAHGRAQWIVTKITAKKRRVVASKYSELVGFSSWNQWGSRDSPIPWWKHPTIGDLWLCRTYLRFREHEFQSFGCLSCCFWVKLLWLRPYFEGWCHVGFM
jgi:hypothetical protein